MRLRQSIAYLLLAVFSLAVLPAQSFHDLFADHKDASENHCRFYHKELGRHIEQKEDHCDIFKANTPLYDAASVRHTFTLFALVNSSYPAKAVNASALSAIQNLPSRAPPVL